MAGEIIHVKPLHHQYDRARLLVIQAREKRIFVPLNRFLTRRLGLRILGFDRIVNDDHVPTTASERAT
jgi:hypothetical protein